MAYVNQNVKQFLPPFLIQVFVRNDDYGNCVQTKQQLHNYYLDDDNLSLINLIDS